MFDKISKLIKPITYIFAFILALTWALFVHFQQYGTVNLLRNVNTKIISDVPITNNISSTDFILSKIPNVADVEITGTKYELEKSSQDKPFQLYIPNQKLNPGNNTVEIKIRNFSNSLQVNVINKYITVEATQIKTAEFKSYIHYINLNSINSSKVEKLVNANKNKNNNGKIKFSGSKKNIDSISSVELIVDVATLKDGDNKILPNIVAIDSSGNKINDVKTLDKIELNLTLPKE